MENFAGYANPANAFAAMALLLRLYRRKGYAASMRQHAAAWSLWSLGLAEWSSDGWKLLITPFGVRVAKVLDWRRYAMLDRKEHEAFTAYMSAPAFSKESTEAFSRYANLERAARKIEERRDYYAD